LIRGHTSSLALAILTLGCSGESSTGPTGFEATVRVSGVVVWTDCRPAVGVSVILDHFYCDPPLSEGSFDFGCDRRIYGSDLTDAEGRYEVEASVSCPRYLTVQARADSGVPPISAAEEVDCRPGDQQFDLVIGTTARDAVCLPDE
jgi:hypothetical protein